MSWWSMINLISLFSDTWLIRTNYFDTHSNNVALFPEKGLHSKQPEVYFSVQNGPTEEGTDT